MNVAISTKLRLAGFCTGIGMLETALETALGVRGVSSESCYHCEWESSTASVLRRVKTASGHEVPIHGNMFTFDGRPLRGKVDGVVAGLPCPAFSVAGKKEGNSDARAWGEDFNPADVSTWGPQPHFLRLVSEILPGFVGIENVPGYFTHGHYAPVGDVLHRLGYEYQDAIIATASGVGASHKRERCFILAVHRDYSIRDRLAECGIHEGVFGQAEDGSINRWRGRDNGDPAGHDGKIQTAGLRCGVSVDLVHGKCEGSQGRSLGREHDTSGHGNGEARSTGPASGALAPCEERVGLADGLRCGRRPQAGPEAEATGLGGCGSELERNVTLGDGCRGECGEHRRTPRESGHPDGASEGLRKEVALGDGERNGFQSRCNEQGNPPAEMPADRFRALPLHAPGIDDWMAWSAVAALDETRMPSLERGVPVVASGDSPSNTDLLRIGGNCVDTLEATTAIGCLLDRWFADSSEAE